MLRKDEIHYKDQLRYKFSHKSHDRNPQTKIRIIIKRKHKNAYLAQAKCGLFQLYDTEMMKQ